MAKPITGEAPRVVTPGCPDCLRKNRTQRHVHFLRFADEGSLAGHLLAQYGEDAQKDGTIPAIIAWVRSIEERYKDIVDEQGVKLPVWQAWLFTQQASPITAHTPTEAPRTEAGRLFAAKVWDCLVAASGRDISPYVRDEFLAALNEGEVEPGREAGPLADNLARVLAR